MRRGEQKVGVREEDERKRGRVGEVERGWKATGGKG